MTRLDDVRLLIMAAGEESLCLSLCKAEMIAGRVRGIAPEPGRMSVTDALATFSVRSVSARASGMDASSIDALLVALRERDPGEHLLLFHLATSDWHFSVVVCESLVELLGCVCVPVSH
jgi:hypothetical protein